MTHIGTTTWEDYWGPEVWQGTVAVQTGDIVLAVLLLDPGPALWWGNPAVPLASIVPPSGWTRFGVYHLVASGDPEMIRCGVVVYTRTATANANWTGTWRISNFDSSVYMGLSVSVYRGIKAIKATADAHVYKSKITYPGISGPVGTGGHAWHMGTLLTTSASGGLPSTDTQRATLNSENYYTKARFWVGDVALSNSTPVAATGLTASGDGYGLTMWLADVIGPAAPTITAPTAANVDLAAGWTLSWTPVGTQTGYRITRKQLPSGTVEYWTGSGWSGTPTTITSTDTSVAFAAATFSNGGTAYAITVATVGDSSYPDLGNATTKNLTGYANPAAPSVVVTGLSGGQVTTRIPEVTVTGSAGSGATRTGSDIQWRDVSDNVLVSTLDTDGVWTVPIEDALPNLATAYVRARTLQQGDQYGPWSTPISVYINAPVPATPVVTVSAISHPVSGLPGTRVHITTTDAITLGLKVFRDGALLHEGEITEVIDVDDYTAAPGIHTYTAVTQFAGPPPADSAVGTASPFTAPSTVNWIVDQQNPGSSVRAYLNADEDRTVGTRTESTVVISQRYPVVTVGGRVAATGELAFRVDANVEGALALLSSGRRLYLEFPADMVLSTRALEVSKVLTFRVSGDITVARLIQGPLASRLVTFPFVEQE